MNHVAISVEGVCKHFRVPLDRSTTLKYRVTHWRSASRYRDFSALEDISFEVPFGQFLGIIGHNGCGKTTLLKILSRIYEPTRGRVSIHGRVSPFLELGVGFNPELTARENVFLNGALLGITRGELHRRVDDIIAFAELQDFADQKLKNFSSGMQVRLAFSVAIQADAAILLMDEVLAVGDARFQEKCFDVFARYKREGRTVVLVTHDLWAVDAYCDRALMLDHGRLAADGRPAEVTAFYRRVMGQRSEAADVGTAATSRWGSGEVEIVDVGLYDDSGTRRTTLAAGRPLVIAVTYRARQPVGDLCVQLNVHRSDGLPLVETNSRLGALPLPCPPRGEAWTVRYVVDALPLLQASYHLSAGVYDAQGGHAYDHREAVQEFRVVDETSRKGMVDLGGRWVGPEPANAATGAPARQAAGAA